MSGELSIELKTETLEKASNVSLEANAPSNTQAKLSYEMWEMTIALIAVVGLLNHTMSELKRLGMDAAFKSANETAKAGLWQLGGGAVLAGTGLKQGVAGCENAAEITKAKEWRDAEIAKINQNTMTPEENGSELKSSLLAENIEGSDITVQVEALEEEPSPAALDEIEDEVFYDAEEEVQSCKKTEPEEQTEETQMVEQANAQKKLTPTEANKLIRRVNREYDANKDVIQAKTVQYQGWNQLGQGIFPASQGLGELEKSEAQKNTIEQQTREASQAQQEKVTDGLNKEIDRLKDFDAFRSNSSSLKG